MSGKEREEEMKKLAADIKGRTLTVTTLEDYPLSYVERNASYPGGLAGRGWAFEFFDTLATKYNFSYKIERPEFNILGSSNESQGSLMQKMVRKVGNFKLQM